MWELSQQDSAKLSLLSLVLSLLAPFVLTIVT